MPQVAIKTGLARARRRSTLTATAGSNATRKKAAGPRGSAPIVMAAAAAASPEAADEEIVSRIANANVPASTTGSPAPFPAVPRLFTCPPPIQDDLMTTTSRSQDQTADECRPWLAAEVDGIPVNPAGVPHLDRPRHIAFLRKNLGRLPAPYAVADASRPWIFYWCLNGLSLLGADVSAYRPGLVETARSMQNPTGGFGGGFGQLSHLATTYAMVLSLAIVGGQDAYDVIDRRAMWKWLCSLKHPSGGFQMAVGGEVDVRGAYCAAVILTLLKLPLDLSHESPARAAEHPTLFTGLADYVRRCQTFEGGISGKPDGEAHGAYAFCALGCLAILDAPHRSFPQYLNVRRLISWLSSRQYAPEGGLCGRTNKLVDGCYSHWVGGCWPLIEASLQEQKGPHADLAGIESDLYHREGLIRYILCCGQDQSKRGGMRDKPSRTSDAYHTCYVLSGLSCAQHRVQLLDPENSGAAPDATWAIEPHLDGRQCFDEEDRINPTDPVYAIPQGRREDMMAYFAAKRGF